LFVKTCCEIGDLFDVVLSPRRDNLQTHSTECGPWRAWSAMSEPQTICYLVPVAKVLYFSRI